MGSILNSIKTMMGITPEYTHFDKAIIPHINSALMSLEQLGIKTEKPPAITSELDTWESIFGDISNIEAIKTYTFLKVQLVFDPPNNSFVIEAKNRQISELEWRLNVQADSQKGVDDDD
jgi:hypothetical protein